MKYQLFLFIILTIILSSCKDQCQILEEKITLCKEETKCTTDTSVTCEEIENAENLIKTINSKITENTDNKIKIEAACSYSLNYIGKNNINCQDAIKQQNGNWQKLKYYMSNFGREGSLDNININLNLNLTTNTQTKYKCGKKILKEYENNKIINKTIRFIMLSSFSLDIISLIQTNVKNSNSNIFIGSNYIKNENSQCDFNEYNRFGINYNDYDYIFCSKSSGWLSETNVTKSNCALTREEIFLLNWTGDYLINWCINDYKNSFSPCKKNGNDYKCINSAHSTCFELRESFYCNNQYKRCNNLCKNTTNRNCIKNCKTSYIKCKKNPSEDNCNIRCLSNSCASKEKINYFYECLNNTNYNCCNCDESCINSSSQECITCKNECAINKNNMDIFCYKNNIAEIENCFYKKIQESNNSNFKNCINSSQETCNNECKYNPCINECIQKECKDFQCFELSSEDNDYFNKNSCNEYSCYYSCQKKCSKLEINSKTSKIMTLYREVKDNEITGSNCNENEIFDNVNKNYCTIEEKISN